MPANNIFKTQAKVTISEIEERNGHRGCIIWLTGLSASGKSTIAIEINKKLFNLGFNSFILDGDNIRNGLNSDLGFSKEDREENIRRIAHIAKLFRDSGQIVIVAFISPFKSERALARSLVEENRFIEVHIKCSIETCMKRDPKGLYKKAIDGLIPNFTGISSPYEEPENPEIILDTESITVDKSVSMILQKLSELNII